MSKKNKLNEIINFYEVIPKKYLTETDNPNFKLHGIKMPFRMCVVAPSGFGKTNFLLNLLRIFGHGKGSFADIYIITSNKDEDLYNYLDGEFPSIIIRDGIKNTPSLDDMDKKYNTLVIWDDLVLDKKNANIYENYYMRARKKNCSVVFLSQSYFDISGFCRKNTNYMVLFDLGGSKRQQNAVLTEWGRDLDKDELTALYNDAISKEFRPLIIVGGKCNRNERFRAGFEDYYNLDTFLKDIPRTKPKKIYKGSKLINDSGSSSESD